VSGHDAAPAAASGSIAASATSDASASAASGRKALIVGLKLAVTSGALVFALSHVSLADFEGAAQRLSGARIALAAALTLGNLGVSAVRWRVLLAAFGAARPPGVGFLWRAQLVGHFYNTFVPGNVGGDVIRAHATRTAFDSPLGAYMVVGLERFFGLAGLFSVGALGLLVWPLAGVMRPDLLGALALVTALVIGVTPIAGRTLGKFLPGRLGRWVTSLPVVARPAWLGVAFLLSFATQTLVAVTGHVLMGGIAPSVTATQSLVLVPLAMIATYVPFSVAGLGVREAAFTFLFAKVGVSGADATMGSLAFMGVYMLVAALGGLLHVLRPLEAAAPR
jgi:uncharacterized membrane protein YbhN (UPF0104 family)